MCYHSHRQLRGSARDPKVAPHSCAQTNRISDHPRISCSSDSASTKALDPNPTQHPTICYYYSPIFLLCFAIYIYPHRRNICNHPIHLQRKSKYPTSLRSHELCSGASSNPKLRRALHRLILTPGDVDIIPSYTSSLVSTQLSSGH